MLACVHIHMYSRYFLHTQLKREINDQSIYKNERACATTANYTKNLSARSSTVIDQHLHHGEATSVHIHYAVTFASSSIWAPAHHIHALTIWTHSCSHGEITFSYDRVSSAAVALGFPTVELSVEIADATLVV